MKRCLNQIFALAAILLSTSSDAMPINDLMVFGDSLSDGGNAYNYVAAATGGSVAYPPPPYAQRFSNGPVAVEQFASRLGIDLQPSLNGGSNFAFGGAATGVVAGTEGIGGIDNYLAVSTPLTFLNGTGMGNQVDQFIASGSTFNPDDSLFVVWGGANDIFTWLDGFSTASIDQVVAGAVNNVVDSIGTLASFGAENFLVPNLVDLGNTPFGRSQGVAGQFALSQISDGFNNFLDLSLDSILDLNILRPDVDGLLQQVQMNPNAYGFDNVTDACFDRYTFSVCSDPDRYLFWDGVHPTERGHSLIAGEFYRSTIPEPSTVLLILMVLLMGFGNRENSFRRFRNT